jgi:predicted dehydrogenase
VVLPLIEAGVPVFCEKPLSETFEQAKTIVHAAEAAGVPVAVNQNFRRCFAFHLAKEVLVSGELGRPLHWIQSAAGLRRDQGWRNTGDRYVMAIMTIHWLDGYRYLFGEEPTTAYCRGVDSPAVEGGPDTGVSLILEFPSGVVVNLSESFSSFGGVNRASLDCERGAMVLDYQALTVIDAEKNQRKITNPFGFNEGTVHLLLDLCDAAEQGRQPKTSVQDNLNSMRMLEAAYRSLESGQPVEVASVQ